MLADIESNGETQTRDSPKVSVVIPTYNSARFLGEAVQSVVEQTLQDWELIVMDDGSTDDTREVVAAFREPRIRYVHQENRGVSATINRGAGLARSAYIALLAADDVFLPEALEKATRAMDGPADVGFCYGQVRYMDEDGNELKLARQWPARSGIMTARQVIMEVLSLRFILPSAVILRRSSFQEVGGFDENLDYGEDTELFARLAKRYPVGYIADPLARRRKHKSAITARLDLDGQERSWLKILDGVGSPSDFGLSRRRLTFYAYLALARQAYGLDMRTTRRYLVKALAHRWPWLITRDGFDAILLFAKSWLPAPARSVGARLGTRWGCHDPARRRRMGNTKSESEPAHEG
jgi:glycosyltransferase involved in cell wall biosynthesis